MTTLEAGTLESAVAGVELVGVEITGVDVAVGDVATGDVSIVPAAGTADHGSITNPAHDELSRFLILPHSLLSIDKPQRAFTEIQLPRYVHKYDFSGGVQFDGSLSLLR